MPSRKTEVNRFRNPSKETPSKDTNAGPPPMNLPPSPYLQYPYPYYPYGAPPQYPQLPPPASYPQQVPMHAAPIPEPVEIAPHRSSSIPSEADPTIDKLAEYIKWLIKLNPTMAESLTLCLEIFQKKDIVFGTIMEVTDALFDKWEISDGVRLMLRSHMKKWERAKAKGRV